MSFPFVCSAMITNLKAELPVYLAKADGIDTKYCVLQWWKSNAADLPHWSALARKVRLVQPSSAAAERVFSILSNSFGDRQLNALEDYIEISVMLQYNKQDMMRLVVTTLIHIIVHLTFISAIIVISNIVKFELLYFVENNWPIFGE